MDKGPHEVYPFPTRSTSGGPRKKERKASYRIFVGRSGGSVSGADRMGRAVHKVGPGLRVAAVAVAAAAGGAHLVPGVNVIIRCQFCGVLDLYFPQKTNIVGLKKYIT
jgi:hypothetical protein